MTRFLKASPLLFIIIFWIKLLESFSFFSHGDALNYHLVGPKLWLETSWIEMTHDLWGNFQSGIFEIIYLIPIALFGNTLIAQLLAQNIHFILGLASCTFIIYRYVLLYHSQKVAALAAISTLTIAKSADFFLYAKNDGVLASCALLVSILICDSNFLKNIKGLKRSLLIGILLGMIPAIKLSGLFVTAPLSLYFCWLHRKNSKEILIASSSSFLVLFPILFRNYYFLGNPFFPGLINIFPGILTPAMKTYYSLHMSSPLTWQSAADLLKSFFLGKILFLSTPLFIFWAIKKKNYQGLYYFLISLSILIFYAVINGGLATERFFFSCYFLNIIFIFTSPLLEKITPLHYVLLLIIILADSKIDKSIKRIYLNFSQYINEDQKTIINKHSLNTQVWNVIKPIENKSRKTWILTDRFVQQFYAPKGIRIDQYSDRPRTEFLGHCQTSDLSKLRRYQYAILTDYRENPCYKRITQFGELLLTIKNHKVYRLSKLEL